MKKNYSAGIWYLKSQVRGLYENYQSYMEVGSLSTGHIRAKCAQCQIEIITTNSNRGRSDIRCLFGCRQAHQRDESNRRSIAYYKTHEGQAKKKDLNGRKKNIQELDPEIKPTLLKSISPYLHYIQILLFFNLGKLTSFPEINKLVFMAKEKLRQHPLDEISKMIILSGYD